MQAALTRGYIVCRSKPVMLKNPISEHLSEANCFADCKRKINTGLNSILNHYHPILDSIGVLFSADDFLFDRRPLQAVRPSFYLREANKKIKNDSSWQQVSFDYTAKGDESFITIGNFSKRDITGETGISMEPHFFVFIDAVTLIPLSANESLCNDWQSTMADIYDQDERHDFLRRKIRANRRYDPVPGVRETKKIAWIDTLVLQEVLFESGKARIAKRKLFVIG